jgi:hypothetical protein
MLKSVKPILKNKNKIVLKRSKRKTLKFIKVPLIKKKLKPKLDSKLKVPQPKVHLDNKRKA